jgi:hypothetical protein
VLAALLPSGRTEWSLSVLAVLAGASVSTFIPFPGGGDVPPVFGGVCPMVATDPTPTPFIEPVEPTPDRVSGPESALTLVSRRGR